MPRILGLSAYYHDSAAALVVDGDIVAAAQEERFTRKKHDARFPESAVAYCLAEVGLASTDLDYVAFYDKPLLKFDRLLETFLAFAPRGYGAFKTSLPVWIKEKLFLRHELRRKVAGSASTVFVFPEHHESHAASAFFPSPFEEAAILTLDGVGEWTTTSFGVGRGNKISLDGQITFPHSLGLLYSAFTYYCGFKVNSGEYKLMGLAPYGRPKYADVIRKHLIDLKPDGSFWLDMSYFGYCDGLTMTNRKFADLFGGPPRSAESKLEARHLDLAASIQLVTEEAVLNAARHLFERYKSPNLVMAGGVALNCVANGRLLRDGPFRNIWVQPAAGDAGGSLGAALFTTYQLLELPRSGSVRDSQKGSFLGPAFADDVIRRDLEAGGVPFRQFTTDADLLSHVATLLTEEKVVGWVQGRMEFGPRALGGRSILGDPRSVRMQSIMNLKVKYRESFRPFAPVVLNEHKSEWFELAPHHENPYMLIVAKVRDEHAVALSAGEAETMRSDEDLVKRVNVARSKIPAVTHVDYSARVQTVGDEAGARFRGLLREFLVRTGVPVLVNTSFNVRGEPIVCTPADALRCFAVTEMDALVLGNCVVDATAKPMILKDGDRARHLAQFSLD